MCCVMIVNDEHYKQEGQLFVVFIITPFYEVKLDEMFCLIPYYFINKRKESLIENKFMSWDTLYLVLLSYVNIWPCIGGAVKIFTEKNGTEALIKFSFWPVPIRIQKIVFLYGFEPSKY